MRSPRGRNPDVARWRNATAIDAVRLSMSTAPRPHTSPSTSSPPNGSRRQRSALTGTTSVWPISTSVGAVGRGDGFLLQIADRASATVLSNDSFQEFHGQYDWLFDEGRLIGGTPVAGVGWIFS